MKTESAWALADAELEAQAGVLNAPQLRKLAKVMARWSRQAHKVAAAMEAAGSGPALRFDQRFEQN